MAKQEVIKAISTIEQAKNIIGRPGKPLNERQGIEVCRAFDVLAGRIKPDGIVKKLVMVPGKGAWFE